MTDRTARPQRLTDDRGGDRARDGARRADRRAGRGRRPLGGVFGATRSLQQLFGDDRVRDTPISEISFTGMGVGLAMAGYRPLVELMFVDFIGRQPRAGLQRDGEEPLHVGRPVRMPMVLKTAGGCIGSAAQHSQCLWGLFAHLPGMRVVGPLPVRREGADGGGAGVRRPRRLHRAQGAAPAARRPTSHTARRPRRRYRAESAGRGRPRGRRLTIATLSANVRDSLIAADDARGEGSTSRSSTCGRRPARRRHRRGVGARTRRLLVVDEDYLSFGLSAELIVRVLDRSGRRPRALARTRFPTSRFPPRRRSSAPWSRTRSRSPAVRELASDAAARRSSRRGGRGAGALGTAICRAYADAGARTLYDLDADAAGGRPASGTARAGRVDVTDPASVEQRRRSRAPSTRSSTARASRSPPNCTAPTGRTTGPDGGQPRRRLLRRRRLLAPPDRRRRRGQPDFLSSTSGLRGEAGASAYCASKFGVSGLVESFAAELSASGIRVNAIARATLTARCCVRSPARSQRARPRPRRRCWSATRARARPAAAGPGGGCRGRGLARLAARGRRHRRLDPRRRGAAARMIELARAAPDRARRHRQPGGLLGCVHDRGAHRPHELHGVRRQLLEPRAHRGEYADVTDIKAAPVLERIAVRW